MEIVAQLILKFLKKAWPILVAIIITLIVVGGIATHKIAKLNKENEEIQNNYKAYQGLYEGKLKENNLLKLTEYEMKKSNDSLLIKLGYYIEENRKLKKIKDPEIAQGISQVIQDTFIVEVPVELPSFEVCQTFNPETEICVEGHDSVLNIYPEISNTIKIEIGVNRVYKNTYKNGWCRFWHFDYKKINSYEYQLDQSNDLIQLTDVKIVDVK